MRLESTYSREVLTTGNDESDFTAELNAVAVEIISDSMYQHKLAAMAREYICNAYDSHIEAGKSDVPIEVILPNDYNPNISFIDYGIGLDDYGVRNVFAKYFGSTKNKTDALIGAFGLGSKCGFSYSDTFTIEATKDGVNRQYAAYMGDDSKPKINLIHQQHTDLPNGVKVTIPIKHRDFGDMVREVEFVASFLPTKPVIKGHHSLVCDDVYEQIAEKGYAMVERHTPLYSADSYALMGNVCYPFNHRDFDDTGVIDRIVRSSRKSIVIPFEMGEVSPAGPREFMSMNDKTKDAILAKVPALAHEILADYQEKLDEIEHPIDVMYYINENDLGIFDRHLEYKGTPINKLRKPARKLSYRHVAHIIRIRHGQNGMSGTLSPMSSSNKILPMRHKYIIAHRKPGSKKTGFDKRAKKYIRDHATYRDDIALIFDELSDHKIARIKQLFGEVAFEKAFKFISSDDIDEYVKEVKKDTSYDRGEKRDTTVYAKRVTANGSSRVSHVETDNPDAVFFHAENDLVDESELMRISRLYSKTLTGKTAKVLMSNGVNQKKIEKLGIPHYSEMVDTVIKYYAMAIKRDLFNSGFTCLNYRNAPMNSILRIVYESSELHGEKVRGIFDKYSSIPDDITTPVTILQKVKGQQNPRHPIFAEVDEDKEYLETIIEKYRLLDRVASGSAEQEVLRNLEFHMKHKHHFE